MAVRIKRITRHHEVNDSGIVVPAEALTVFWADDNDNEGVLTLDFATYTSIEAEWNEGQGTTFTAIDAAVDTALTANYETQDDNTSTQIATGRGGYTFGG